jgi:hypothetical protein
MRRLLLGALGVVAVACSGQEVACRVGADCATGVCLGNGTCKVPEADGGATGGGGGSASGGGSATGGGTASGGGGATGGGSAAGGSGGDGGTGPSCLPNADGTITRAEFPSGAGLRATYKVAKGATFNTAGTAGAAGTLWDLTGPFTGDADTLVTTEALAGKWFENDFAGATYVSRLNSTGEELGVFEVTPSALLLRGLVSPTDSFTATKIVYDTPVKVVALPFKLNDTWTSTSVGRGKYLGNQFWTQTDTYASTVDKAGELITPFARFPVLRVRTTFSNVVGFITTTRKTLLFAAECFGGVATITSANNEAQSDFTATAELRRLSP